MKVIWNFIVGCLISVWTVVAIFTTVCLLAQNDYGISKFGDYSVIIVDNKYLEPYFNKYDVVIVQGLVESEYKTGDKVFFYYGNHETNSYVNLGDITNINVYDGIQDEIAFGDLKLSSGNLIGKADGAKVFKKGGLVLSILESRWGFMFLIILPTIYAVVYEVYEIYVDVKKGVKKELKSAEKE